MIEFACPNCENTIRVSENAAGKSGQCKSCGENITVPATPPSAVTSKPTVASVTTRMIQRAKADKSLVAASMSIGIVAGFLLFSLVSYFTRDPHREAKEQLAKLALLAGGFHAPDTESSDKPITPSEWANVGTVDTDGIVKVEFKKATIGKVMIDGGDVEYESTKAHVAVYLTVTNLSPTKKLDYTSWGGSDFDSSGVGRLRDELGNTYARRYSGIGVGRPKGQQSAHAAYPGTTFDELLVFEVPVSSAKFLYLTLPNSAYGAEKLKDLRIKIPVASITQ